MKLSVIVTVYNLENYIERCLKSIQNQTYKNFECIVVDDGSTDHSISILSGFAQDSRFTVIQKENQGVSATRNVGIQRAEGEYILFVDGDDYLDASMLENIVKLLENNKVDAIFSGYKGVYENGKVARVEIPKYDKTIYEEEEIKKIIGHFIGYSYDDLYKKLSGNENQVRREFASVWRFVYNTKIIKEQQVFFDEKIKFGEDILFNSIYLSLCKKLYIAKLSDYNYLYRDTGLVFCMKMERHC